MTDISLAEQRVCELLAPLLIEDEVGDSLQHVSFGDYPFSPLESFLPEVLRGVHDEWRDESLDGIYPEVFRKVGPREVELIGLAIFISDQTLTPLHLQLMLSRGYDCVSWINLKLGKRIGDACHREPYGQSKITQSMLHIPEQLNSIDWFYHVGYGERRS